MSVCCSTRSMTVIYESAVRVSADPLKRKQRMRKIHESKEVVAGFVSDYKLSGFVVKVKELAA